MGRVYHVKNVRFRGPNLHDHFPEANLNSGPACPSPEQIFRLADPKTASRIFQ